MVKGYSRPPGSPSADFATARIFEEEVGAQLAEQGVEHIQRFSHNDDLDIWVPGYYLEVKEKRQPLTDRWHLLEGVEPENLFVLDELSVRRGVRHWPAVYFLLRDVPLNRCFLAPIWEVIACRRARINRQGKGKWVVDLTEFRQLNDLDEINPIIMQELPELPWKSSACLGRGIGQV